MKGETMNKKHMEYRINAAGEYVIKPIDKQSFAWREFVNGVKAFSIKQQPHNNELLLFELIALYEGKRLAGMDWECSVERIHRYIHPHNGVYVLPDVPRSPAYDNAHRAYVSQVKYADRCTNGWNKTTMQKLNKLTAQVARLELTAEESAFLIGAYKGMML